MLKSVFVKNFALLDHIEIEFLPGLNIITGETGAGKSILIDALGSTLGEKVDGDILRAGSDKAIVESTFFVNNLNEVKAILDQNEIDELDNSLILRKEVGQSGRNRVFVNDTPATASVLSEISDLLVDLHGQHEHQALLKVKYHVDYLDAFGNYDELLEQVRDAYDILMAGIRDLEQLKQRAKALAEKREIYQHQLKEISAVKPQPGEEDELIQEEKILNNSEKLYQLTNELYTKLYDAEQSVYDVLAESLNKLDDLNEIDSQFGEYREECQSARISVEEISKFVQHYMANVEFSPERLEEIRTRLAQFSQLRKKYGRTIEDVLKHKEQLEQELSLIENVDEMLETKQKQIVHAREHFSELAVTLSGNRQDAAKRLEAAVVQALAELGMQGARFQIQVQPMQDANGVASISGERYKAHANGIDQVEFFMTANTGDDLKPLAKVASGGEISRIMLSLKTALAEADRVPVLIFDEIDIGISGRIAQAVGRSLKRLARTHQVICITHLPQIASLADHHFVVEKFATETTTYTKVRKLQDSERALEVAKLLGGETVSEAHIQSAKELINQGNT
ncbi:DNA repair protein RecN [candidate division KSB1 bacterium]|nr:DNA repair protein RecN [candidate division KSB1 bacterium]